MMLRSLRFHSTRLCSPYSGAVNRSHLRAVWFISLYACPDDTKVHQGFQDTQGRTADGVLSGVQNAIAKTGVKNILVTGHSLGAAIATMDAIMLSQNLDSDVNINTIVFGLPRGGNSNWANLVDKTVRA